MTDYTERRMLIDLFATLILLALWGLALATI